MFKCLNVLMFQIKLNYKKKVIILLKGENGKKININF
jgi:hypothetical protein